MGPKKSKKTKKEDGAQEEETTYKPKYLPSERDSFVYLSFELNIWKHMNFTQKFRDSTYIFSLKKLLRERHGRIDDLQMYLNEPKEQFEITNEMLTLRQIGCEGVVPDVIMSPEGEPILDESKIPTFTIHYDFKPANFSDPVLLYFNPK